MTRDERRRGREQVAALQRKALEDRGLSPEEVETAMAPLLSFNAMCDENDAVDALIDDLRDSIRRGARRSTERFRLEG